MDTSLERLRTTSKDIFAIHYKTYHGSSQSLLLIPSLLIITIIVKIQIVRNHINILIFINQTKHQVRPRLQDDHKNNTTSDWKEQDTKRRKYINMAIEKVPFLHIDHICSANSATGGI